MRLLGPGYRDLPRFVLRRADRLASELNAFLIVVAIGLAMLDLLCLLQRFVEALPPDVVQFSVRPP
jgi:hypothetical protein